MYVVYRVYSALLSVLKFGNNTVLPRNVRAVPVPPVLLSPSETTPTTTTTTTTTNDYSITTSIPCIDSFHLRFGYFHPPEISSSVHKSPVPTELGICTPYGILGMCPDSLHSLDDSALAAASLKIC